MPYQKRRQSKFSRLYNSLQSEYNRQNDPIERIQRARRLGGMAPATLTKRKNYRKASKPLASSRQTKGFEPLPADTFTRASVLQQSLNFHRVIFPPSQLSGVDLNKSYENGIREGARILVKGMRVWFDYESLIDEEMELHFALCQRYSTSTSSIDVAVEFFSNHKLGEEKRNDFDNDTTVYQPEQRYQPINADRWKVITHTKTNIGPQFIVTNTSGTIGADAVDTTTQGQLGDKQSNKFHLMDKYYKINQVLSFDTPTAVAPDNPYFMFVWACPRSENIRTAVGALNVGAFNTRYQVYYEDLP